MIQSLWTAASGLLAQQTRVDTISNNIANINTTGFKRDQASFSDLMYARLRQTDQTTYLGQTVPAGLDRGHGVRVSGTQKQYGQGTVENTGQDLDLAIQGDGFFAVRLPDGGTGYTRNGEFHLDADRNVVNAAGYQLLAGDTPLVIPAGATELNIAADGTVSAKNAAGNLVDLGQIGLTDFSNPAALTNAGNGIVLATPEAGQATAVEAGADTLIAQRALERSNVDMAQEMVSLILAQRAYELSSRAVQTADQMLGIANGLRR